MQYLSILKGQKLVVKASFSCAHENRISVREFAANTEVFDANSHMNNNRYWESPVNTSGTPMIYTVQSFHKNGPPSGGLPWHESAERVVFAGPVSRIVGYEDWTDGDYNDAVATILWN